MTEVQTERRITSMNDVVEMTADMMTEIYNDGNLTPAEKIKAFSMGQRAIVGTRQEMRKMAMDLAKMGMKPNGQVAQLTFDATTEK
jgi:hypothetical protein